MENNISLKQFTQKVEALVRLLQEKDAKIALLEAEKEELRNEIKRSCAENVELQNKYDNLTNTIYPEGLETVPKRFAISWRNKWMIQESDVVVTYITHSWGGAAQFADLAKRKKKRVINIKIPACK